MEKTYPFVVPESDILDYVENLGIHDLGTVAARFQMVAELTKQAVDQLDESDLQRIKRIADEDSNRHYRRIMKAIVAAAEQDARGINAAHLTASLAVQLIFRWSPEYFSALNCYGDELRRRKLSLPDRHSPSHTSGRSTLHAANDQ